MSYRDLHEERAFRSPSEELEFPYHGRSIPLVDAEKHLVIATINTVSAELLQILGPMLWAALVVLFLVAEFSPD
jgi:hypothetical protein